MIYRFQTPNPDFDGIRSGVQFHNGHGETDSSAIADELLAAGYALIPQAEPVEAETIAPLQLYPEPPTADAPDTPNTDDVQPRRNAPEETYSKPKRKTR